MSFVPGGFETSPDIRAPKFAIFVDGGQVYEEITKYVTDVSYEQALDMADKMSITLLNPNDRFTDDRLFDPGKYIDVYMGYGSDLTFLGRTRLARHAPSWPSDGVPTLTLTGYDDWTRIAAHGVRFGGMLNTWKKEKDGRMWRGMIGPCVAEIFMKYGLQVKIDPEFWTMPLPGANRSLIGTAYQKKGTSDADFLKAIANLVPDYAEVFVQSEVPTGHLTTFIGSAVSQPTTFGVFRRPPRAAIDSYYKFTYGMGDTSAILSASIDFALTQNPTKLTVYYRDRATGQDIPVTIAEDVWLKNPQFKTVSQESVVDKEKLAIYNAQRKALKANLPAGAKLPPKSKAAIDAISVPGRFAGSANSPLWDTKTVKTQGKVKVKGEQPGIYEPGGPAASPIDGYLKVLVSVGDYNVMVKVRSEPFTSAKAALAWGKSWLSMHRDSFVTLGGSMIGIETLKSGTVHQVEGLGSRYSGDYYFVRCNHHYSVDGGYNLGFTARKIITDQ